MEQFFHHFVHVFTVLFLIGVAGCMISIPIVAVKFLSVTWEKDPEEETGETIVTPQERS